MDNNFPFDTQDKPSRTLFSFKGKHLALFLVLDLLLFVLVFSAGVRVGQNLANKPVPVLAGLPGPVVKKKVEALRPEVKKVPAPAVPMVEAPPKAPVVTTPLPKPAPAPAPAEKVARAPKEEVKPAKPPAKKAALTIQISSHKDEETAQKIVDQLKKKGFEAFFTTVDLKDKGKWHRVRVGKFPDSASAQQAAKEVGQALGQKVMIVPL